jgi:hypothetical protein
MNESAIKICPYAHITFHTYANVTNLHRRLMPFFTQPLALAVLPTGFG